MLPGDAEGRGGGAKRILRVVRGLAGPLVRSWDRYPALCGLAIGAVLTASVLAFAPAYAFLFSDPWMFAILGVLTMVVAIVARARSRDKDEW